MKNMEHSERKLGSSPRPFWNRPCRPRVEIPHKHSVGIVDRLFGDLTHLSFVVELGSRGSRNGKRS